MKGTEELIWKIDDDEIFKGFYNYEKEVLVVTSIIRNKEELKEVIQQLSLCEKYFKSTEDKKQIKDNTLTIPNKSYEFHKKFPKEMYEPSDYPPSPPVTLTDKTSDLTPNMW